MNISKSSPGEVTRFLCNAAESLLVTAVANNLYICDLKVDRNFFVHLIECIESIFV